MAKNKLRRYADLLTFPNVFQEASDWKGDWSGKFFKNKNPIALELACGKGEYTLELARRNPNINFIGIDKKGARVWKGAKTALDEGLGNVAFIRTFIQFLPQYFGPDEIAEIWITFPDPYPRKSDAKKRLASPFFIGVYGKVLKPGGRIHLKTDSALLFESTLESIQSTGCAIRERVDDVHASHGAAGDLSIQTYYEKMHIARKRTIQYICFSLS